MILSLLSYLLYLELSIPLFKSVFLPAIIFFPFFLFLPEGGFILYIYTSGLLGKILSAFVCQKMSWKNVLENNALKNILKAIILGYIFEGIFIPSTF